MARRKKQDEDLNQENLDSSDDTFGLPEIEYEPLKREEPMEESTPEEIEEPQAERSFQHEDRSFEQEVEEPSELPQEEEQPKRRGVCSGTLRTLHLPG